LGLYFSFSVSISDSEKMSVRNVCSIGVNRTLSAKTSCRCTKQHKHPYSIQGVHPVIVRRNSAPQRKTLTPQYCNMTLQAPGYLTGAPTRVRTRMGMRPARTCLLVPPSRMTIRSKAEVFRRILDLTDHDSCSRGCTSCYITVF